MSSVINGFRPIERMLGWFGYQRSPAVVPAGPQGEPAKEPEGAEREKTGTQAHTGIGAAGLWPDTPRASPTEYRAMRKRIPAIALARSKVVKSILSGSWSVDADDDAPAKAKDLFAKKLLPHRTVLLKHAVRALDYGFAPYEVVPGVYQGLTIPDYFKPLRQDLGTQVWLTPRGHFAGLSTDTDNQVRDASGDSVNKANGPTITGPECMLWAYDAEPGEWYGNPRLENCRELTAKWIEVQNKIGALINKESGSVTKVTHPPEDIAKGAAATAEAFARNIASGSAYIAVESVLGALTAQQRRAATVDQVIALLAHDLWGVENLATGGNGPAIAACQAYSAYLDTCLIRAYLQPERGIIEGSHGTKAEATDHGDTGTIDCEAIERDFVEEALNPQVCDWILTENWGPNAKGKVRIKANPLRDVQESIDTMLIQNVSTNAATADWFIQNYDFDPIAERRGIQKRKVPLPPIKPSPAQPPQAQPGANGHDQGLPTDANDRRLAKLAASRIFGDE